MRYLVLDDEKLAADYLAALIKEVSENSTVDVLCNPQTAFDYVKKETYDVCFLDIQMPGIDGIEFAGKLKEINSKMNIIFVTGFSEHMGEAFKLDASDYIMKPATVDAIAHALENLRYPVGDGTIGDNSAKLQITCFGNFEVLVAGKPVKFKFDKTKELLAYLVNRRGARCNSGEVMAILWENDGHDSYYRMLKKDLLDTFGELDCENFLFSARGQIGLLNIENIDCDYFKWYENPKKFRNLYKGEYMAQYSWAEEVNALLDTERYLK